MAGDHQPGIKFEYPTAVQADPNTALEKDEFLKMCVKVQNGVYKMDIMGLTHDFTQYYHEQEGNRKGLDEPTASHIENLAMAAVSVAD